jgi:hypothetical protein
LHSDIIFRFLKLYSNDANCVVTSESEVEDDDDDCVVTSELEDDDDNCVVTSLEDDDDDRVVIPLDDDGNNNCDDSFFNFLFEEAILDSLFGLFSDVDELE